MGGGWVGTRVTVTGVPTQHTPLCALVGVCTAPPGKDRKERKGVSAEAEAEAEAEQGGEQGTSRGGAGGEQGGSRGREAEQGESRGRAGAERRRQQKQSRSRAKGRVGGGWWRGGLTLRFLRTHLFIRTLPRSHVSSASTMHTVSFLRLPLMSTVSPRKSWSSSMVCVLRATTELSSLLASSTTSRFGFFFFTGLTSAGAASAIAARGRKTMGGLRLDSDLDIKRKSLHCLS